MILHPAILALLVGSLAVTAMVLFAAWHGLAILRHWNLGSGSERQLQLERRTYLVSTLLGNALLFELLSLALLVFVADRLHLQINGAMCAVGTFNANAWGYPALLLKVFNVLGAGLWLTLNFADSRGYDHPLVRVKNRLLLALVLPVTFEAVLLWQFFRNLRGDVITSCCGSLFSASGNQVAADLAGLPPRPAAIAFYLAMALTLSFGLALLRGRGRGWALALSAALSFFAALAALISVFAPIFYQLPHHHCPFCILQREYFHIGYLLYAALFAGVLGGLGCGALAPFRNRPSLQHLLPKLQRRLALLCLLGYGLFTLIVTLRLLTSDFQLFS